jgi:hypothetical protein
MPEINVAAPIANYLTDSALKRTANSLEYGCDSIPRAMYEGYGSVGAENIPVVGSAGRLIHGDVIDDSTGEMRKTTKLEKGIDSAALILDVATVVPGKGKALTTFVSKIKKFPGVGKALGGLEDGLRMAKNFFKGPGDEAIEESVDIFRAVSPDEFDDVITNQTFRYKGGGMEGKQFGLNLDETIKLADDLPDTVPTYDRLHCSV